MAVNQKSLCDTFRRQAIWTWDSLRQARTASCQLGEESLTDFNLLRIRYGIRMKYSLKHSLSRKRRRPVRTGNGGLLVRVASGWLSYPSEGHRSAHRYFQAPPLQTPKSGAYQSDDLVNSARASNPPRIPVYCLYMNVSNWRALRRAGACGSYPLTPRSFGCMLVGARQIQRLRSMPSATGVNDIMAFATPWHCLVCCRGYGNGRSAE